MRWRDVRVGRDERSREDRESRDSGEAHGEDGNGY